MTPAQKDLVKESWGKVLPIQETAAELFYGRLFSTYPDVEPMFKGDMKVQGEKLMKMLDQAVNSLDNLEPLIEPLKQSGRAHRAYGVKEEDYGKVAECLLWTLQEGLGDSFDEPTRDAWVATYTTVSGFMIEGAAYGVTESEPVVKLPWFKRILQRATA